MTIRTKPQPDVMLAGVRLAVETLSNTLRARGYQAGSDTSEWAPEVQKEVATLSVLSALLAKAEGASS